ncbi:MAG: Trk system potassium transporter TrkA [Bacteroidales bacterium]|nr:Trk system potassium transporter TrkA [Bacteroidales bacterium]
MKVVIGGAGEVGSHLAKLLSEQQHDIVMIDSDPERLNILEKSLDILTLNGIPTSIETLTEAQVSKADLFIAVTPSQDSNLVACILASRLGAGKTIARIDTSEFMQKENRSFLSDQGISYMIYPEKIAAKEIASVIRQSTLTDLLDFSGGRLSLLVLKIDEKSSLLEKTLMSMTSADFQMEYRAVAIIRDGQTIIPHGQDCFKSGDVAYVVSNHTGMRALIEMSGTKVVNVNNIMIVGGSRIAKLTAKELGKQYSIKILEKNKEQAYKLSNELEHALIIHADGTKADILLEEGLTKTDAFVALTGNSETNILSCVWAKSMGVKRVIAEVENLDYIALAEKLGIDSVINKKLIAASNIYRFTLDGEVSLMKTMTGAIEADVFEFVAQAGSPITQAPVAELKFPQDAIIGGVIRGHLGFIVDGKTTIQAQDHVVVFAMPQIASEIGKFFVK